MDCEFERYMNHIISFNFERVVVKVGGEDAMMFHDCKDIGLIPAWVLLRLISE